MLKVVLNTITLLYYYYLLEKNLVTIHSWNQKNNSCNSIKQISKYFNFIFDRKSGRLKYSFFKHTYQLYIFGTRITLKLWHGAIGFQNIWNFQIGKYSLRFLRTIIFGKYLATIHYWNQKNTSCNMEQLDFKIFEFQLLFISWIRFSYLLFFMT